jgi:phosphatidylserine decarboxylase
VNVGTYAFAQLLRVLPRTRITRAVGRLCDLELPPALSRAVVGAYVRAYRVDLDEAAPLNGARAYSSFDAFFTRSLRDGARTIQAPDDVLVSPADGRLDAVGTVDPEGAIVVKGRPYRVLDLLGSAGEAARYAGGQFAVVYLSPRDYHRVHAPAAGWLSEVRSYPGELFPVNSVSERHIPGFLARNRRVALAIDSEPGGSPAPGMPAVGRVSVVMVAAMIVGRITVTSMTARDVPFGTHLPDPPPLLGRGSELAVFHLGSTAVIFVEPGKVRPFDRSMGAVKLGDPLSRVGTHGKETSNG